MTPAQNLYRRYRELRFSRQQARDATIRFMAIKSQVDEIVEGRDELQPDPRTIGVPAGPTNPWRL